MTFGLHPHLIGVPHLAHQFTRVLDILRARDDTIFMTSSEIGDWFLAHSHEQTTTRHGTTRHTLLVDEPAAGMTHEETARTAELIREINRTATLIVVEHDMQFIRMISRTVTLFHEGRILMQDTMEAISADPRAREVYLGHRA